ncbi:MAG: 1-acyl-sn-glycerol-3-phosphate acyltransferase [Clostridia bacterium]|nr:1-acyl-sn-glycerol-3-phosphate acyltransferase [Clostridia bacterium]
MKRYKYKRWFIILKVRLLMMLKGFVKLLLNIYFSIFYRVKLVNKGNIPPKGGAILCANHVGQMDMFFIGYKIKRMIHYMAKEELFRNPLQSAFIRWAGAFPVRRGTGDVEAIKTALKIIKQGHILGIFPEGTRRKDGQSGTVKPGVAMFAVKTGVPIIPVAIEGNYKLFGKVKVVFGKPYYLEVEKGKKYSNDELIELSQGIMKEVYALLEAK